MPPGDAADGDGLLGSQAASRGEADPSAPLPLLSVGNNGFRLKKGTLWGPPDPGKAPGGKIGPPLAVSGRGFEAYSSVGSPRTPSSSPGLSRNGGIYTTPGASSERRTTASRVVLQHGHLSSGTPNVSNVVLTLDTPGISSRRLQPAMMLNKRSSGENGSPGSRPSPGSGNGGGGSSSSSSAPQVMRIDHSAPSGSIPDGEPNIGGGTAMPVYNGTAGGAEEIQWLREQLTDSGARNTQLGAALQRVQQESYAIRSTLMAQQGNGSKAQAAEEMDANSPMQSPRSLQQSPKKNGLQGLQANGRATPADSPTKTSQKNRMQRKKQPHLTGTGRESEELDGEDGDLMHVHPKSEDLTARILDTLSKKAPFDGHDESDLMQLIAAMAPVEVKADVDVLREGDQGDLAYWVEEGSLSVIAAGEEVDTINKDTVFGEVALIYDLERTATIRAKTDCSMWLLHRQMFQHILRDKAIAERKAKFTFLKTVKIFQTLSQRQISRIADVVDVVFMDAEVPIIKEGEDADAMFVIHEGQAVVSQQMEQGSEQNASLLRILKEGDYFGERALLHDEKRSATVTAASKVKLLRLDKTVFTQLLGSLHAELMKLQGRYGPSPAPKRLQTSSPSASGATASPDPQPSKSGESGDTGGEVSKDASPSTTNGGARPPNTAASGGSGVALTPHTYKAAPSAKGLSLLKQLGSGGYGRVSLVRDTKTRRVFALKRVCKAHLLAHNGMMRCEWLLREKRVLEELEHPFIVGIHATYSDDKNLFLLLGVALGGDLYRLIEKLGQVPEKIARFYAASLVLALSHIHGLEIIYRDLKPENVLLDSQGYVKLCDFGFAKKVTDRTYTRCGTPDYTAPEMLLNQGVNQACDWWALGILIFEMLSGVPPFTDPGGDDMKTYQNITHGELSRCYPDSSAATDEARALIQGLCTVKVAYRLGYLKGGADDVMAHAWFVAFDWDGLVNMTIEPPWRPSLSSSDDTTCFDEAEGDDSLDGPANKVPQEELEAKWKSLQAEYSHGSSANHDMNHLC